MVWIGLVQRGNEMYTAIPPYSRGISSEIIARTIMGSGNVCVQAHSFNDSCVTILNLQSSYTCTSFDNAAYLSLGSPRKTP